MSVKVETKDYLQLVENTNNLVFFDIESSGFKGDYNSALCVSFKPYKQKPFTIAITEYGNDKAVVKQAKKILSNYNCWVSYYGKGFDYPFLNTRLLKWKDTPIPPRHHIDMFFTLKAHTKLSSHSQEAFLDFLGTKERKLKIKQNVWSEMGFKMDEHMPILIDRCESDVIGLEELYDNTKHLIREIKLQS